jgi:hypothetical protein
VPLDVVVGVAVPGADEIDIVVEEPLAFGIDAVEVDEAADVPLDVLVVVFMPVRVELALLVLEDVAVLVTELEN